MKWEGTSSNPIINEDDNFCLVEIEETDMFDSLLSTVDTNEATKT